MKTHSAIAPSRSSKKLFYRINEVATLTGIKPYVLRYWETEFAELSPEKDASDHRRYRTRDIDTVKTIRKLLYEDRFTIKGARQRLKDELRKPTAEPEASNGRAARSAPRVLREPEERKGAAKPRAHFNGAPRRPLGETLHHLRREVDDLLSLLKG